MKRHATFRHAGNSPEGQPLYAVQLTTGKPLPDEFYAAIHLVGLDDATPYEVACQRTGDLFTFVQGGENFPEEFRAVIMVHEAEPEQLDLRDFARRQLKSLESGEMAADEPPPPPDIEL